MDDIELFTFNVATDSVREAELEGRLHYVFKASSLKQGVWPGNRGPVLYRDQQLGRHITNWDHKPLVVDHPTLNNGRGTACDPEVINKQRVGLILNINYNGILGHEFWVDKERALTVDSRLDEKIKKKERIEVSTGIYHDKGPAGTWNGKDYLIEATNIRPDHIAFILDGKGACSTEDGVGCFITNSATTQNQVSFSDLSTQIRQKLYDKYQKPGYSWNGFLEDVFDGFFVYYMDGKLWKQDYTLKDDVITFGGEPKEVVRVSEYRELTTNAFLAQASDVVSIREKETMEKKQLVDALILNGNGRFEESEREDLMKLGDATLKKLHTQITAPVQTQNKDVPVLTSPPVPTPTPTPTPEKKYKLDEIIQNSSPEDQEMFQEMKAARDTLKQGLIDQITANKANPFNPEWLKNLPLPQLRGMAVLAGGGKQQNGQQNGGVVPMYMGAQGGMTLNAADIKTELQKAATSMDSGITTNEGADGVDDNKGFERRAA